jgi:hypothetical protein
LNVNLKYFIIIMASPRNYQGIDFKPQMRTSNIQTYKPGEFIKNF